MQGINTWNLSFSLPCFHIQRDHRRLELSPTHPHILYNLSVFYSLYPSTLLFTFTVFKRAKRQPQEQLGTIKAGVALQQILVHLSYKPLSSYIYYYSEAKNRRLKQRRKLVPLG